MLLGGLGFELGDSVKEIGWVFGPRIVILELRIDSQDIAKAMYGVVFECLLS